MKFALVLALALCLCGLVTGGPTKGGKTLSPEQQQADDFEREKFTAEDLKVAREMADLSYAVYEGKFLGLNRAARMFEDVNDEKGEKKRRVKFVGEQGWDKLDYVERAGQYAMLLSHKENPKRCAVAFRGTDDLGDIIQNHSDAHTLEFVDRAVVTKNSGLEIFGKDSLKLKGRGTSLNDGGVPAKSASGWSLAAAKICTGKFGDTESVWSRIRYMFTHKKCESLEMTGHSLGGALANMCAMAMVQRALVAHELQRSGKTDQTAAAAVGMLPSWVNCVRTRGCVRLWTVGEPRTLAAFSVEEIEDTVRRAERALVKYRIMNRFDAVPSMHPRKHWGLGRNAKDALTGGQFMYFRHWGTPVQLVACTKCTKRRILGFCKKSARDTKYLFRNRPDDWSPTKTPFDLGWLSHGISKYQESLKVVEGSWAERGEAMMSDGFKCDLKGRKDGEFPKTREQVEEILEEEGENDKEAAEEMEGDLKMAPDGEVVPKEGGGSNEQQQHEQKQKQNQEQEQDGAPEK